MDRESLGNSTVHKAGPITPIVQTDMDVYSCPLCAESCKNGRKRDKNCDVIDRTGCPGDHK